MIKLENVSLVLDNKILLDNINWNIAQNENWVLFGRNGSGKSLLLQIITGYLRPSSGSISYFNQERVDLREIRKKIGFCANYVKSFLYDSENVYDLIISGLKGTIGLYDEITLSDREAVDYIIELMDIKDLKERYFKTLSDGEKQKVLIARALISNPDFLILDEPCAGLDIPSREEILKLIMNIKNTYKNMSLIYVTHHIEEILEIFQKILILKKGRIFEKGNINEIVVSDTLSKAIDFNINISKNNKRFYVFY